MRQMQKNTLEITAANQPNYHKARRNVLQVPMSVMAIMKLYAAKQVSLVLAACLNLDIQTVLFPNLSGSRSIWDREARNK